MNNFEQELSGRLQTLKSEGLYRELRRVDSAQGTHLQMGGRTLVNFSSNDYLGLANHPALKEATAKVVERFGAGSGAARLISGSLAPHHELEEALAAFKGTQAALSFSSGYATAIGTICALLGKDDVIIIDKLVHACVVDAARLSGAKLRVFDHNDLNDLETILKWADAQSGQKLVVTESVFSMDGDRAPLREIVDLKDKHGAWLMIDEAHATGLYGASRRGLAEELGVGERIEIQMGTLGKALGAGGGYICGSRTMIDYLLNRARSFIFSTAPVPAAAAAATAGIRFVQSIQGEELRRNLWNRISTFEKTRNEQRSTASGAIIPVIIGDEGKTVETANLLRAAGFYVPAVRYPTVARGQARLRVTLTATHSLGDIFAFSRALDEIVNRKL